MKKILKYTMLSAVLMNCATTMFAQNDTCDYAKPPATTVVPDFKLSSFVLPDFRRRALTTNYGLSNRLNSQKKSEEYSLSSSFPPIELHDEKSFGNRFSLLARVSFSDIHYTRKRQKETYFSSNIRLNTNHSKEQSTTSQTVKINNFEFLPYIDFRQINRHYINEKLFVGYSPFVQYHNQFNNHKIENYKIENDVGNLHRKNFQQSFTFDIPLEIGYGRIESVGDARHAIHIFDALARRGVIQKSASSEDITRFAEFIAELKNKRFLDSRHRKIYEMEALDSFLMVTGFRDTLNMLYFTTLEEYWVHGNVGRSSGMRWSFYTLPGYNFSSQIIRDIEHIREDMKTNYTGNWHTLNTRFGIAFTYEKPINLFWQNSFNSSLEYEQRNIRSKNYYDSWDEKHITYSNNSNLNYRFQQRLSYFPTTRTSLYGQYGFYHYLYFTNTNHKDKVYEHSLSANLAGGASYFFSPQLQLNLNTSLEYGFRQDDWWQDTNIKIRSRNPKFQFNFELSLNYTFY
jgi:hypothetical protein